jgi:hypothetical protein
MPQAEDASPSAHKMTTSTVDKMWTFKHHKMTTSTVDKMWTFKHHKMTTR